MKRRMSGVRTAGFSAIFSVLLSTICPSTIAQEDPVVFMSTGQRGGLYFHTGTKISELANELANAENEEKIALGIAAISSGGSKENLANLLTGKAELAIIQSDVLFGEIETINTYIGTDSQLHAIASLFPEYTQVLVHEESGIENIIQLAGQRIYIGQEGSGTEINAAAIMGASGIRKSDYTRVESDKIESTREALTAVCNGEITAAVAVTSTIYPKLAEWKNCLTLLDADSFTRSALLKSSPFYGFTTINLGDKVIHVLYTRAVLVASSRLERKFPDEDIFKLTRLIVEDLPAAFQKGLVNHNASMYRGPKVVTGLPIEFHLASEHYFKSVGYLKSNRWKWILTLFLFWGIISIIKLHLGSRSPQEDLTYSKRGKTFCFFCEISIGQLHWLAWLFGQWLSRLGRSLRDLSFFKSPLMIAFYGFVVFLWVAMLLILHFENEYFLTRDIPNQFENLSVSEFSIWLLQIVTLGASSEGMFPNSLIARAVTVAIPIIGAVGAILAVIMATLKEKSARERRAKGLEVPNLSNHVVMCGWNTRSVRIANELTTLIPGSKQTHLVVIAESDHDKPLEFYGLKHVAIHYLRGMSSDSENLKKVNAEKAKAFVVLAGEKKIGQRNFRSIFTVEMISERIKRAESKKPRIVVDMVFHQNLDMFIKAGADRVINTLEIGNLFLAFSTFNMGFSNLITNLMSLTTRPVISRFNSRTQKKVVDAVTGLRFSAAWERLAKSGLNLLAVYPGDGDESAINGLYPNLFDPVISGEEDYLITENDALIVIENQSLACESINSRRYTDCQSDAQRGLDEATPILLIDREPSPDWHLRKMLERKCEHVFHISAAKEQDLDADLKLISWDGGVDSINECIQMHVIQALQDQDWPTSKLKCVIPAMNNLSVKAGFGALHQDDGSIALITKLKTLDEADFHFIAEIQCESNLRLFKAVGVHQPIPVHEFTSLALTKVTLFGGEVFGLLARLMQNFFWGNLEDKSLRKIPVNDSEISSRIIEMNYQDAAYVLFEFGVQLIAIISCDLEVTVLPHPSDNDFSYQIQPGDELFVIS